MNLTTKILMVIVAVSPTVYVLTHDHLKKPHSETHCFYCRHEGKILVGSLTLAIGIAIYFTRDLIKDKNN